MVTGVLSPSLQTSVPAVGRPAAVGLSVLDVTIVSGRRVEEARVIHLHSAHTSTHALDGDDTGPALGHGE